MMKGGKKESNQIDHLIQIVMTPARGKGREVGLLRGLRRVRGVIVSEITNLYIKEMRKFLSFLKNFNQ